MATRSWLSTADGDINTAANWSGGAVPIAGDDVIFDAGSVNATGSLTTWNAVNLASMTIGPNYTGQVGSSNVAPLKFNVTGKLVVNGGGSQHYLSGGTGTIVTAVILNVGATGNGNCSVMGTITTLIVQRGTVKVYSGTTTTCHFAPSATATLQLVTPTITTLHQMGGTVDCLADSAGTITTLNQLSGSAIVRASQTLTTYNGYGGTCWFLPTTTMTTANVVGSTLILAGMDVQTVTTLNLAPNGTAYINQGALADTIGTTNNFGGGYHSTPKQFVSVPT